MISKIRVWFREFVKKRCGKCRYFEHEKMNRSGIGEYGFCIKNPPSLRLEDKDPVSTNKWPRVFSHYSVCGGFRRGKRISQ